MQRWKERLGEGAHSVELAAEPHRALGLGHLHAGEEGPRALKISARPRGHLHSLLRVADTLADRVRLATWALFLVTDSFLGQGWLWFISMTVFLELR